MSRTLIATMAGALVATPMVAASSPATANPAGTGLVISEVFPNGGGSTGLYTHDFVELYNPTGSDLTFSGQTLQYRSATGSSFGQTLTLQGTVPANGYFLVQVGNAGSGGSALPVPADQVSPSGPNLSGTSGTVALAPSSSPAPASPGDLAGDAGVIDVIGWGSPTSYETAPSVAGTTNESLNRTAAADSDDNSTDFARSTPTPTNAGEQTPPPPPEPTRATIEEIQGTGTTSPYDGDPVITQGVVTAAYPTGGLNGFALQMAGSGETLDESSDGIFVYTGSAPTVQIGDHVEVTGTADEFFGLTQIAADSEGVQELSEPAAAVKPAAVAFPRTDAEREALESMLLAPAGPYTLTDNYNAGNNAFGELGLATGNEPLRQPTDVARPATPEAAAVVADNAARRVLLDDGATINFLANATTKDIAIPYLSGPDDQVRVGAAVTFVDPVILSYGFSRWRFQPVQRVEDADDEPVTFEQTRTAGPEDVGGSTRLASFNVLNYFTDLGQDEEGCDSFDDREGNPIITDFCTVRGAYTQESFERQEAKIVAAINGLQADVVALMEIENSAAFGHEDRDRSLGILVAALNEAAGSQMWDFVRSPAQVPADEDVIRLAFIYKPAAVQPVGDSQILQDPAFVNARQPLAQTFRERGEDTNGTFVAIANHFKSKGGGSGATGDNADSGDGQGAFNGDRVRQAQALVGFADEFSTGAGTDQVFLLGDFNAYTQEDPLQVFGRAGYVNVSQSRTDESTYQFSSLVGSLDHVFASAAANATVTGADIWNINSVEPVMYEYSRHNYNRTILFDEATPYRASDHDPVLVGFEPQRASSVVSATTRPVPRGRDTAVRVVVEAPTTATGTVEVVTVSGQVLGTARLSDGAARVVFDTARRAVGTSRLTVRYSGDANVLPSTTTVFSTVRRSVSEVSARVLNDTVVAGRTRPQVRVTVDVPDLARMRPDGRVVITNRGGDVLRRAHVEDGVAVFRLPVFTRAGTRTLTATYTGNLEVAGSSSGFTVRVVRR